MSISSQHATSRTARRVTGGALFALVLLLLPAAALGDEPRVRFDAGLTVACRDVTPDDFADSERLIEATYRVSVRIARGDEDDLIQLVFELESPERRLPVWEFAPRSRLESDVEGTIEITRTREKADSIGASLGGIVVPLGEGGIKGTPTANVGTSRRDVQTETARHIAPQRPVLVSGTTQNEHGVFFKLKPSRQATLEGVQTLTCRYRVPGGWRGDWVRLVCQARGESRKYVVRRDVECGRGEFYVGLHLQGDAAARAAARRLAASQAPLASRREPPPPRFDPTKLLPPSPGEPTPRLCARPDQSGRPASPAPPPSPAARRRAAQAALARLSSADRP